MQKALLIIAKRPAPGLTKTRLSPPLSETDAARLYENFLLDMLDTLRQVPGVTRFINYWPPEEIDYFQEIGPDFELIPQQGRSLGERLNYILSYILNRGFDQAAITNSDSPTLPAAYLGQAFDLLERADLVLGPCDDGGYYLIGLNRPHPRLLLEVEMSTPTVAQDTLTLAEEDGMKTALLPLWYDVDTQTELDRLRQELAGTNSKIAPHTRGFLKTLPNENQ